MPNATPRPTTQAADRMFFRSHHHTTTGVLRGRTLSGSPANQCSRSSARAAAEA